MSKSVVPIFILHFVTVPRDSIDFQRRVAFYMVISFNTSNCRSWRTSI